MPLQFVYGKHDLEKSEFPLVLYDLKESMQKWATAYTLDLEFSFKKIKDLNSLLSYFDLQLPIFFVEGLYREMVASKEDLSQLVLRPSRVSLVATLIGPDCNFDVQLKFRNPHFRGFSYYDPEQDDDTRSEIHIRPQSVKSIRDPSLKSGIRLQNATETEGKNLLKAIYAQVETNFPIPPYPELLAKELHLSPDGVIEITTRQGFQSDICFAFRAEDDDRLRNLFGICLNVAEEILNARFEMVGQWKDIESFFKDNQRRKQFKITKCGVNTTATGGIGKIRELSFNSLSLIPIRDLKSADFKLRWESIKFSQPINFEYKCSATISTERRKLSHAISLLLNCEDHESAQFLKCGQDLKDLTRLPFDNLRHWSLKPYSSKKDGVIIDKIKEFIIRSNLITRELGQEYMRTEAAENLKVHGYYDSAPGLFVKSDVKFNATVKDLMKRRFPNFQLDRLNGLPAFAGLGFVRKSESGLYNYLYFSGDPHWHAKIFVLDLTVSKYSLNRGAPGVFWWAYSRSSPYILGSDLWWHYESKYQLICALESAFAFIEDVGEKFYERIGSELIKTFNEVSHYV